MLTSTFRSCLGDSLAFSQCASNNQALSFTFYYLGAKWNVYWLVCRCAGSDVTELEKTRLKWIFTGKGGPWLSSHPFPFVLGSHGHKWQTISSPPATSETSKQACDSSVFRAVVLLNEGWVVNKGWSCVRNRGRMKLGTSWRDKFRITGSGSSSFPLPTSAQLRTKLPGLGQHQWWWWCHSKASVKLICKTRTPSWPAEHHSNTICQASQVLHLLLSPGFNPQNERSQNLPGSYVPIELLCSSLPLQTGLLWDPPALTEQRKIEQLMQQKHKNWEWM